MINLSNIKIYQVFYSKQTSHNLDAEFVPLDNLSNERPDWSEYWPIRNLFQRNCFSEDDFIGVFSPKFFDKTQVSGKQVISFISQQSSDNELIAFSPYFDQNAFFLNIFEQGSFNYPGLMDTFKAATSLFFPTFQIDSFPMDSTSNIFCNYFAAKASFWKKWLEICDRIFRICEDDIGDLSQMLNSNITYNSTLTPSKVFFIERVASLILATDPLIKRVFYNPTELPLSNVPISRFPTELLILDALKIAFNKTNNGRFISTFSSKRIELLKKIQ
jgi:hypothetical protein